VFRTTSVSVLLQLTPTAITSHTKSQKVEHTMSDATTNAPNTVTLSRKVSIYEMIHFHRPKTFVEAQPYILCYGTALATVSPSLTAYQLCRLYKIQKPPGQIVRLAMGIFPHQAVLMSLQLNASTAIKDLVNPWGAFFIVGVLQGGIYGFSNIHFSKAWNLGTAAASAPNMVARVRVLFRGSGFAGVRDTISQGIPFMLSGTVHANIMDVLLPTEPRAEDEPASPIDLFKHWTSLFTTSIAATYMSQGLHNCQTTMQTNTNVGYAGAVTKVWTEHGLAAFYRGAEARVIMLLIINMLNELLLKPAWEPVRETRRTKVN
jgi:hypothetical protein